MSKVRKKLVKISEDFSDSSDHERVKSTGKLKNADTSKNKTSAQLDVFSHELKLLLAQIQIISSWIKQKFGIELFDRESLALHHVNDFREIEEIAGILSTTVSLKDGITNVEGTLAESDNLIVDISDSGTDDEQKKFSTVKIENPISRAEDCEHVGVFSDTNSTNDPELPKPKKSPMKSKTVSPKTGLTSKSSSSPKKCSPKKSSPKKVSKDSDSSKSPITYQCDECGKVLATSANLREHQKIHGDVRPYGCEICGKSFRRSQKLKLHLLTHKGEEGKTHQCRFCGRLFIQRRDLNRHERTHTGEKPFQCPQCPKSFNVNQHLTYHIRTHTGEKPHKCDVCEKSFSQPNTLRLHRKLHEGIKYIAPSRLMKRKARLAAKVVVEQKAASAPIPVKQFQIQVPTATTQSNLKKFFITIPANSVQNHQANTLSVNEVASSSNNAQRPPPQTSSVVTLDEVSYVLESV